MQWSLQSRAGLLYDYFNFSIQYLGASTIFQPVFVAFYTIVVPGQLKVIGSQWKWPKTQLDQHTPLGFR